MAVYFFDSSGIVKNYISEQGSAWIKTLADPLAGNTLYLAEITGAELVSAIVRRQRRGATTLPDATAAIAAFRADFAQAYFRLDITPILVANAMSLVEQHGLRGYDSVQLAAALELRDLCAASGLSLPIFIAADAELNSAAIAEGLVVDNPNSH